MLIIEVANKFANEYIMWLPHFHVVDMWSFTLGYLANYYILMRVRIPQLFFVIIFFSCVKKRLI